MGDEVICLEAMDMSPENWNVLLSTNTGVIICQIFEWLWDDEPFLLQEGIGNYNLGLIQKTILQSFGIKVEGSVYLSMNAIKKAMESLPGIMMDEFDRKIGSIFRKDDPYGDEIITGLKDIIDARKIFAEKIDILRPFGLKFQEDGYHLMRINEKSETFSKIWDKIQFMLDLDECFDHIRNGIASKICWNIIISAAGYVTSLANNADEKVFRYILRNCQQGNYFLGIKGKQCLTLSL